jgi:hypothetical protein
MAPAESDRREYPRLKRSLPLRYKFISSSIRDPAMDHVCDGATHNLSLGGLLLLGPIPKLDWLKELLIGRISVGVNFLIPGHEAPVKALTRVAWIEAVDQEAISMRMGLRIIELPAEQRKALGDFLFTETAAP